MPVRMPVIFVSISVLVYEGFACSVQRPEPSATKILPIVDAGASVTSVRSPRLVATFFGCHLVVARSYVRTSPSFGAAVATSTSVSFAMLDCVTSSVGDSVPPVKVAVLREDGAGPVKLVTLPLDRLM